MRLAGAPGPAHRLARLVLSAVWQGLCTLALSPHAQLVPRGASVICGYHLVNPSSLCNHMHLHMGECTFSCEQCSKSYTLATKLWCHQKSHLAGKPCKCGLCGMGYTLPQSLAHHVLTHKVGKDSEELAIAVASLAVDLPQSARKTPQRKGQQEGIVAEPTLLLV